MIDKAGRSRKTEDAIRHVSDLFPGNTNLTCTFTAHATANTWSAWAEIADSGATTLSSSFTTNDGHLTSILIETVSDNAAIYMFEISWGAAKTIVTKGRFAGAGKFQAAHITDKFWAPEIPSGETVYYRLKTETGVADTCTVSIRTHIH